jgi:transcriptional regulator with XRE-family HTH domain
MNKVDDAAFYATLGPRLRRVRERDYLSVRQVATRAGLHPVTIQRWEAGATIPHLIGLIRLCHALHIHLDILFPPTGCWYARQSVGVVGASTTITPTADSGSA